ncbi:TonB-dependent receptor plug domain-containing protein [Paenirhodobacter sp.]|uniref:TonB-dependent receptor plug domain-containing protein n=1 Tax=Paenirhodobacter sp. TaxID=1965326 RepID=UPI003B3C729D
MIRPTHISILALTALLPSLALAQDEVTLDTIIVSGGLTPIESGAYGGAYTVLTGEEIEKRGIATVQDALRAVPGVSVNGSGSSYTQVRIRGGEANHTLILIDGIEATGGADEYILSGLETANIDRIEVLRGPQSVYYGSNASAGVINIITRKGEIGTHYGGSVEYGNGFAVSGHASHRSERGSIALNLSGRHDKGYDESGDGGERDGTDRRTATLSGDWKATEDLTLGFTLRRAKEKYRHDSTSYMATDAASYVVDDRFPHSTRQEFTGGLWAEFAMLDGRLTHRLDYQDSVFKQNYNDGDYTRGETEKLKYRLSYGLDGRAVADSAHLLNLLAEKQKDSSSSAPDYEREMTSLALEYRGSLPNGVDVQAGIRHDDNKVFEDDNSWNLGLSWRIPETGLRLHASAGKGVVNPSYFELYANADYGSSVYKGNPHLKPEKNRGYDIGVEAEFLDGRALVDVTYFNQKLEDEITSYLASAEGGVSTFSYRNQHGHSPRQGVEVSGRFQATDDLLLSGTYTYLDAKNADKTVAVRRPRHELGLTASLGFMDGRGTVSADVRYVADNYDSQWWGSYAKAKLPDYATLNLAAGYDLTENLRLTGRVVNLFDKGYSDVWGYASQGRTVYAGVEAKW